MIKTGRIVRLAIGAAFCFSLLAVGGCTKYASPDDLKKLDEANQAALSAEKQLDQTKSERMGLEKQLAAKQAELDSTKAEFEKVKTR